MSVDAAYDIKKSKSVRDDMLLGQIEELDKSLIEYYPDALVIDNALTSKTGQFPSE